MRTTALIAVTAFCILFTTPSFGSSYCYQVNRSLNIAKNVNGRRVNCGTLRANQSVRKTGTCSNGWCQMLTPNRACDGWGWIFVGRSGENAVRYRCPSGRPVISSYSSSRTARNTDPVYPNNTGRGSSELAASAPRGVTNARPASNVARMHDPNRANRFTNDCIRRGIRREFCRQVVSPNTASRGTFRNVYGRNTPFYLVPDESEWAKGFELLSLAQQAGGCVREVRNWYRPTRYNRAVSGASSSSHLSSSAIDFNYCTARDKANALRAFRSMRARTGKPAGIGTYGHGSRTIHIDYVNRVYGSDVWE